MVGWLTTVNGTPLLTTPPTVTTRFPVLSPLGNVKTIWPCDQVVVSPTDVPLILTVLAPWLMPKLDPATCITWPAPAVGGYTAAIVGVVKTVNCTPLLATPPTVTTKFPELSPPGCVKAMAFCDQSIACPTDAPLIVSVLVPWLGPKFDPVICMTCPVPPAVGPTLVIVGAETTVKGTALLAIPDAVTTTLPVVAPAGTGTTIVVGFQLVGVAAVPLNVTLLVPTIGPKFIPSIVTKVPTAPEARDSVLMTGAMKVPWYSSALERAAPLLFSPPTIRTIPLGSSVAVSL